MDKRWATTRDLSGLQNAFCPDRGNLEVTLTLGRARMAGDRLNREFCGSGDAAHRLSLQAADRFVLSSHVPSRRLTLNNGILRPFTSRIGTLVPASHPHLNPFTRYTLLQGVS